DSLSRPPEDQYSGYYADDGRQQRPPEARERTAAESRKEAEDPADQQDPPKEYSRRDRGDLRHQHRDDAHYDQEDPFKKKQSTVLLHRCVDGCTNGCRIDRWIRSHGTDSLGHTGNSQERRRYGFAMADIVRPCGSVAEFCRAEFRSTV